MDPGLNLIHPKSNSKAFSKFVKNWAVIVLHDMELVLELIFHSQDTFSVSRLIHSIHFRISCQENLIRYNK